MTDTARVIRFGDLGRADVAVVGGKNSSLGELIGQLGAAGVRVPEGFATSAAAYREYLKSGGLDVVVRDQIDRLHAGAALQDVGSAIRAAILEAPLPPELTHELLAAYRVLAAAAGREDPEVAVRSSATAEDLPDASFAGQQESFLNVRGEQALLDACRRCYASLFTDRAIDYRERMGFDQFAVALSIGVQRMVRSDLAGAGVVFTLDTESGFRDVVVVNAAWGRGRPSSAGRSTRTSTRSSSRCWTSPTSSR